MTNSLKNDNKIEYKPKISVITACYNSEKFIEKTIQSVLDQTYQNWELLCVNDMSSDNTLDILKKMAQKDSRIKIFDKKTRGEYPARNFNFALDFVTGNFICLLGHDDTISLDLFEKEILRYQETNADIIIPDCCFIYPDFPNKQWTIAGIQKQWGTTNTKINRNIILDPKTALMLSLSWKIHGFNLIKSSIVKDCKFCEESMNGDEYSTRLFYLKARTIAFSEGTYFYYQLNFSITKKMTPKRWNVFLVPYLIEKLLIEYQFPYSLIEKQNKNRQSIYRSLLNLYIENQKQFSEQDKKIIEYYLDENKKLLSKFDISHLKPPKKLKIFSIQKRGYKRILEILGVIKIKFKGKKYEYS